MLLRTQGRGLGHMLRTYHAGITENLNNKGANGHRIQIAVGKGRVQSQKIVAKSIVNALVKLSSKEIYGEVVGRGQEVDLHVERTGI